MYALPHKSIMLSFASFLPYLNQPSNTTFYSAYVPPSYPVKYHARLSLIPSAVPQPTQGTSTC